MFNFICNNIDFAHKLDKPSSPTEEYFKHIHCFNEILYLVRGDIDYTVESETRHLEEGDLVFIPSGKYHFATVNPNVHYERYVLKFPDKYIPEHVRDKLNSGPHFFSNSKKYDVVFRLFDGYFQEYKDDELYTIFLCEVVKLMTMLCHEPPLPIEKHDDFIAKVLDYINTNIHSPLTIQTLADEFHYSRSFINTEFKKRMHVTVMKYIRTKKAIAAHQMILSGAKKTEVAYLFGFETYSTFYRTYKNLLLPDLDEKEL